VIKVFTFAIQALKKGRNLLNNIYFPTKKPEDWQSLLAGPEKIGIRTIHLYLGWVKGDPKYLEK